MSRQQQNASQLLDERLDENLRASYVQSGPQAIASAVEEEPEQGDDDAEADYQKTNKNEKFLTVSSDQRRQRMPMATRDQPLRKRGLWTISRLFVRLRLYDLLAGCVVTRGCKHQRRTARLWDYRRGC